MWRRRILHGVVLLGSASTLLISCSGSSSIDMNFGKEAGADFDAPAREVGTDGNQGVGGASGAGGDVGNGGAGGSVDDGGTDADSGGDGDSGGMALIHQYQHPNRPPHEGAA
jgi:hypothetical protein